MEYGRGDVKKIMLPAISTIGRRVPIQPTVFRRNMYEMMSSFLSGLRWLTFAATSPLFSDVPCTLTTLPIPLVSAEPGVAVADQARQARRCALELTEAWFPVLIHGRPKPHQAGSGRRSACPARAVPGLETLARGLNGAGSRLVVS